MKHVPSPKRLMGKRPSQRTSNTTQPTHDRSHSPDGTDGITAAETVAIEELTCQSKYLYSDLSEDQIRMEAARAVEDFLQHTNAGRKKAYIAVARLYRFISLMTIRGRISQVVEDYKSRGIWGHKDGSFASLVVRAMVKDDGDLSHRWSYTIRYLQLIRVPAEKAVTYLTDNGGIEAAVAEFRKHLAHSASGSASTRAGDVGDKVDDEAVEASAGEEAPGTGSPGKREEDPEDWDDGFGSPASASVSAPSARSGWGRGGKARRVTTTDWFENDFADLLNQSVSRLVIDAEMSEKGSMELLAVRAAEGTELPPDRPRRAIGKLKKKKKKKRSGSYAGSVGDDVFDGF